MMPGLLEGQEKMSKSDPNSAIFMEDSESEVASKIKKAFCPPLVSIAKCSSDTLFRDQPAPVVYCFGSALASEVYGQETPARGVCRSILQSGDIF